MTTLEFIVAIFVACMGSSGLWAIILKMYEKKSNKTKLLIGLAHDRICYLGGVYIERGWITADEYENLHDYLFVPYEQNGGNGTAKKIMDEVGRLPIKKESPNNNNSSPKKK